ncbi:MAG: hypothetical protein R8G66_00650 [Cytophagales bacterium]|nr:hypothetical protein [Cytophagales bacterium]
MDVIEESLVKSREHIIRECYEEVFPKAAMYIRKQGGDLTVAKEVFQEALVLYYEKLISRSFEPDQNHQSYFMGMVKNRWLKHQSKLSRMSHLDEMDCPNEITPTLVTQRLLLFLKQSGERCLDLLQSFYYEHKTMKELAGRFGYASERSATVQKYKCLEKVRNEVKNKSLQYEDFFE